MSKFIPQNFNDCLAIILIVIIPVLWLLQGIDVIISWPAEINGALIATWVLITQYYFRKAPPINNGGK